MNILLTGGTGLLGRALCRALLEQGHTLTVLSRRPERVPSLCGEAVRALARLEDWHPSIHYDAVINLAGAPIIDMPWTEARLKALWDSRIALTKKLNACIEAAEHKPAVLISGSAIGIYGDRGEEACPDTGTPHLPDPTDFGAQLCAAWEHAAQQANAANVRVCILRTGLVLSPKGGLLARMRLPFKAGLGARLGNGQQWMSWIHIDDFVRAVLWLLVQDSIHGAFNITAPQPVRNAEFTRDYAKSLGRIAIFSTPECILKLLLGKRAYLLLGGQHATPDNLIHSGFQFKYERLDVALKALN